MEEQIKKAIEKLVEMGYITINPNLVERVIYSTIEEYVREINLKEFTKWLLKP